MRTATIIFAVISLVAAVYGLPASQKDALEPNDLKTDSSYGLGYAYPSLGYYGGGYYPYSYGYGLYGYSYPSYGYYGGYGYPAYYLR